MRSALLSALLLATATADTPDNTPSLPSWTDQFKCTADLDSDQPSIIEESDCTTRTDANSQACLWCDLSSLIGPSQGLCVSSGIKEFLGAYWESVCAGGGANPDTANNPVTPVNPIPIPVIPLATNPPTKAPVAPPPAVNPPPVVPPPDNSDNGSFAGAFSCATDDSSKMISDASTCTAKKDITSEDKNCVWCPVPLLGGGCITNSDASSISWMCKSFETLMQSSTKNLRGVALDGWEILDTTCLGDTSGDLNAEKENCAGRNDKSGNSCVWCEGGGVLGYCVSTSQQNILGDYMTCEQVSAPEVSTSGWEALDDENYAAVQ